MSNRLIIVLTTILLYSCGNKLDGKIESREKNGLYLVNTSATKEYNFTVKKTTIINDSSYVYSTFIIPLAPGDEKPLGSEKEISAIKYPIIEVPKLKTTKVVIEGSDMPENKQKDILKQFKEANIKLPKGAVLIDDTDKRKDTVINGEALKYEYVLEKVPDTLHPYPISISRYKYEVTGQMEIKGGKIAATNKK